MRTPHISRLAAVALGTAALVLPLTAVAPVQAAPADKPAPKAVKTTKTVVPTLDARASLSADYVAKGPESGAKVTPANGRKGPFPGQVIPGFSAMAEIGNGSYWGLPDNGFGAKANSDDFLLRIYQVKPRWETADGGKGTIKVQKFVQLRDPNHNAGFKITNEHTRQRNLTGADFDVESLVVAKDGSFWIGEEFGPYLLHFSADGVLLSKPVPMPGVKSPSSPDLAKGETANLRNSKGFEAMAASQNGRYLYPILEGYLNGDDKRTRVISQFDTRTNKYTGRTWKYQSDTDDNLVGDAFMTDGKRMLVVERDDFWGAKSVTKRIYEINLNKQEKDGFLAKKLVVDLLKIDNPAGIGIKNDPGYGVDKTFQFPFQSVETVVRLKDGRLLVADDNNYPGNDARKPGSPDNTEMIIVDLAKKKVPAANPQHTVFSHRGASGYRPEHTLAAYEEAINQCADYIEPDLVSTKDGVLVDRHENEISGTTDVATRPEFADRKTTKTIDGSKLTGWFTEDFTLAELRSLRAKERLPELRPQNTKFDGLYQVPTFDEVVDLARRSRTCSGKPVGVIPEIKHGSYFDSIGLSQEEGTVKVLEANGYGRKNSPVMIQSFEVGNLKELNQLTKVQLVQLVDCSGAPADLKAAGNTTTYKDMVTPSGMKKIAKYADSVGLCKNVMIPRNADGSLGKPTDAIKNAHAVGLEVTGWTFRAENSFLPKEYRSSANPADIGDMKAEVKAFLAAGMDHVFSDQPDLAVQAVAEYGSGN
ncbi:MULTISPECIES: esterase-like activity of phytase family protein [unclassified Luteococcus]|uniref:esterase-like activity of phytase family protein n=1 Tax=unclassified Luteococcus TaxID=2639923 RepID=UPI00313CB63C